MHLIRIFPFYDEKDKNDPIYWRLRWIYFHSITGTRFLISVAFQKLYQEILWHSYSITYPFYTLFKLFVYWGTVLFILLICTATPPTKTSRLRREVDYCRLQGFCASKVILSCYMYRRDFSGYLRKLGQLPVYITNKIHMLGSNATYFVEMICKSSVRKLRSRWKNISGVGTAILLMQLNSVPNATYDTKETNITRLVHEQEKCEDKVRSDCLRQAKPNISQGVSNDTFFRLDLSQVADYNEIHPPVPYYLKTYEDDPIIGGASWDQWGINITPHLIFQDDSDDDDDAKYHNDLLSNKISELLYDQVYATIVEDVGPIYQMRTEFQSGSHRYCLIANTERLTLLNEKKVNKQEKDDFSFTQRAIELAMDNCATFHVCKDKFLFIGEIRPCPNIRVKGVYGVATAGGIGTIRFTITSKTGE